MKTHSTIFIFSVLIATLFTILVNASDEDLISSASCKENEVFNECGTACPERCPYLDKNGKLVTPNPACNRMCVPGCFCVPGFVRDLKKNNDCVSKSKCTPA